MAAGALAVVLSGCGGSGQALAQEACAHVNRSIRLYSESEHQPDAARASAERARAIEQLEAAEPLAAMANSDDPQWNPLMTTLQEIGRDSEANLVAALQAQCATAGGNGSSSGSSSGGGGGKANPVTPSSVPGQPAAPTPSTLPGQ